MLGSTSQTGRAVDHIEFTSKAACETAKVAIRAALDSASELRTSPSNLITLTCVPR